MRKLRCIAVDDEPLALDLIEGYIVKTPFLELVERCSSSFQAMIVMAQGPVDLIFLDIQMPGLSGIEFSKAMQNRTRIIFTTAYDQYALEGFKVDALDYLLKPFSYTEFLKAANKAQTWFSMVEKGLEANEAVIPNAIMVKSEYRLLKIELSTIKYIEGLKDYLKIHVEGSDKPIVSQMSLKAMEEKLPSEQFYRVHRSFIVNLDKVGVIERSRIVFGKIYIPISDTVKEEFTAIIEKRFLH